MAMMNELH
jgi:ATP-binding cassette, subfamily C (CFTR/MRP), member 1